MKSIRRPQLVENGAKNLRPVGSRPVEQLGQPDGVIHGYTKQDSAMTRCVASSKKTVHPKIFRYTDKNATITIRKQCKESRFFFLAAFRLYHVLQSLYFTRKNHTTWDILVTKLAKGTEPNGKFCRYGVKNSNVSPSWNRSYVEKSMIVVPVSCERKNNL